MASNKEVALYYPSVDITDESLIKTAALYWDELQTIVPNEIKLPYQTKCSQEARREGFLKPCIVDECYGEKEVAGMEFSQDIEDLDLGVIRENEKHRNTLVYTAKIDTEVVHKLESKLNTKLQCKDHSIISLPESIANLYISRLASVIGSRNQMIPLTNSEQWQGRMIERYFDYESERRDNQACLASLSLQTVAIDPNVKINDIRTFREEHQTEIDNYRQFIRELARQISGGLGTRDRQKVFEEIATDKFLPAQKEIIAKLTENDTKFMVRNIYILLATFGTMALSGGTLWAAALGGAVSVKLNHNHFINKNRKIVSEHPLGYLYEAQKEFGANQ